MSLYPYHTRLFNWHCQTFFPFRQYLSKPELHYIEGCFELSEGNNEVTELGQTDYSHYSYSHELDRWGVNSSRFAVGSLVHAQESFQLAWPVLQKLNLNVPTFLNKNGLMFGGLGWDFSNGIFKFYGRSNAISQVRSPYLQRLLNLYQGPIREDGIVSLSFYGPNPFESKVYVHPLTKPNLTYMITDKRGIIPQQDVQLTHVPIKLKNQEKAIIKKYKQVGELLDTISIRPSGRTLYFP